MIKEATSVSRTTAFDSTKVGLTGRPHVSEELVQFFVGVPQIGPHFFHSFHGQHALLASQLLNRNGPRTGQ
jgi:hypothetical protein